MRGADTVRMSCGDLVWSQVLQKGTDPADYKLELPQLCQQFMLLHGFASGKLVAARRIALSQARLTNEGSQHDLFKTAR